MGELSVGSDGPAYPPAGQDGPDHSAAVPDGNGNDECPLERVEFADGGAFLLGAAGDFPKPVLIPARVANQRFPESIAPAALFGKLRPIVP